VQDPQGPGSTAVGCRASLAAPQLPDRGPEIGLQRLAARFGFPSFQPEMTDLQRQVLDLFDIPTSAYTAS
jgi:hypothetical protein